ncbi:hypothetical protein [uncultured Rikenella sp.]|nr:hypothetical protein [uncultured Rikenella sp.]
MSVGYDGYNWSSSVSGCLGIYLYFYMQGLDTHAVYNRAHGFPLRCLSE